MLITKGYKATHTLLNFKFHIAVLVSGVYQLYTTKMMECFSYGSGHAMQVTEHL